MCWKAVQGPREKKCQGEEVVSARGPALKTEGSGWLGRCLGGRAGGGSWGLDVM